MVDQPPVLRARAGVRDARHDDELLVRVRQLGEEIGQVLERSDAVPLPPHDERRHRNALRVEHRQVRRHVDVGAGRHGGIEGQHRIGERFHDRQVARPGMVAREDAAHELAVDRPAVARAELRQALAALRERRAAFAGPHQRIERCPLHALGMALCKEPRPQRARRGTVKEDLRGAATSSAPQETSALTGRHLSERP